MDFKTFVSKFAGIAIEYIRIGNKYFLAEASLVELSKKLNCKIESIGLFLGEEKDGKFSPGPALLEILAKVSGEKAFVNYIGEIDFLYGRGLKKRHITSFTGGSKEGFFKLIQNEHDENIGYGKISKELDSENAEIANMLDKGDYIRREKQ
ncbi:MAG: hypothetical protein QME12_02250 [Nanoarchaeota archaeon]|nr:hypothetical protein [Nanoarchaeota archaeon]